MSDGISDGWPLKAKEREELSLARKDELFGKLYALNVSKDSRISRLEETLAYLAQHLKMPEWAEQMIGEAIKR